MAASAPVVFSASTANSTTAAAASASTWPILTTAPVPAGAVAIWTLVGQNAAASITAVSDSAGNAYNITQSSTVGPFSPLAQAWKQITTTLASGAKIHATITTTAASPTYRLYNAVYLTGVNPSPATNFAQTTSTAATGLTLTLPSAGSLQGVNSLIYNSWSAQTFSIPFTPGTGFTKVDTSSSAVFNHHAYAAPLTSTAVGEAATWTTGQQQTAVGTAWALNGVGAATGLGAAPGVGAAIWKNVGAAAGTATAPGIGAAADKGVGTATGVGAAPGIGAALDSGVGTATGIGAATAVGNTILSGVGTANGVGTAPGVGAARGSGVGTAAGAGTAPGIGAALWAEIAAAAGLGTAPGIGAALYANMAEADGTGTAPGIGSSSGGGTVITGIGDADGVGAAPGIGLAITKKVVGWFEEWDEPSRPPKVIEAERLRDIKRRQTNSWINASHIFSDIDTRRMRRDQGIRD